MPTKKHRYTITADEEVEATLERRRRSFPAGTSDSRILATLVVKGDEAIEREEQADAENEERRRAAARLLAARFERPDGFDLAALREASVWLRE